MKDNRFGFVRVATASPPLITANTVFNARRHILQMEQAERLGVDLLVFGECSLTGYSIEDLFCQEALQQGALDALETIRIASRKFKGLAVVGLPMAFGSNLYNCVAAVSRGKVLGIVPKQYLTRRGIFDDARWFASGLDADFSEVTVNGKKVPFGLDILFECSNVANFIVGLSICQDGWPGLPVSCLQAHAGATITCNSSASPETMGKEAFRRLLFSMQGAVNYMGLAYASIGPTDSTTNMVMGGYNQISENGTILAEGELFQRDGQMSCSDIDVDYLINTRRNDCSFNDTAKLLRPLRTFRRVAFSTRQLKSPRDLVRKLDPHPLMPKSADDCQTIFNIQTQALATRFQALAARDLIHRQGDADMPLYDVDKLKNCKAIINISGGKDSTAALAPLLAAFDALGIPRCNIIAQTLPGFGTTAGTKNVAYELMRLAGVTIKEIDIREICFLEMKAVEHKPFGIDLTGVTFEQFLTKLTAVPAGAQDLKFENLQARLRTLIALNEGFLVGTNTLSEAFKGWLTYGDHVCGYNPNSNLAKTAEIPLLQWMARERFQGKLQEVIATIIGMPMSPELLLPGKDGQIAQVTEALIGSYELTDFYAHGFQRCCCRPQKMLYLVAQAGYEKKYSLAELRHWLIDFYRKFFTNQFKRSCQPDATELGSVGISPRRHMRLPSDASPNIFLQDFTDQELERTTPPAAKTKAATVGAKPQGKTALGLIDCVNAFGSAAHTDGKGHFAEVPVPGGEEVGPIVGLLQEQGDHDVSFAGNDKHKPTMFNFAHNNPGKQPYVDHVLDRDGEPSTIFNAHCVEGTWSADYFAGIRVDLIDREFPKGTDPYKDSFSACGNPELIPWLRAQGVTKVRLVGNARDVCVGMTAIGLAIAGFEVEIVLDATRALDLPQFKSVLERCRELKVKFVTVAEVLGNA